MVSKKRLKTRSYIAFSLFFISGILVYLSISHKNRERTRIYRFIDKPVKIIFNSDNPFTLEMKNGNWFFINPVKFPANDENIEKFINDILHISLNESLDSGNPKDYGITEDSSIIFIDKNSNTLQLMSGNMTSDNSGIYFSISNNKIYIINSDHYRLFNTTAPNFKSPKIFNISLHQLKKLNINYDNEKYIIIYENNIFRMLSPESQTLDNTFMKKLTSSIFNIKRTNPNESINMSFKNDISISIILGNGDTYLLNIGKPINGKIPANLLRNNEVFFIEMSYFENLLIPNLKILTKYYK